MKRLIAGLLIALAVIALSAVIASFAGTTRASEDRPLETTQAEDNAPLKGGSLTGDVEKRPFVGIALQTVEGGAEVLRVADGGPSAGILLTGDVITAVNGHQVTTAEEVIQIVRSAAAGDVLTFTVLRDGVTLDVDVTVGEREFYQKRHQRARPPLHQRLLSPLLALGDHFVKAEIVLQTADGFKTFKAVAGTVSEVNVESGTFVLVPKDGSEAIPYQISDDTVVITKHLGDLGGLNTTDKTLVVDIDGAVKLVQQGDRSLYRRHSSQGFKGLPGPGGLQHRLASPRFAERFEGRGFDLSRFIGDLPSGIRGPLEGQPTGPEAIAGDSGGINEPAIQ